MRGDILTGPNYKKSVVCLCEEYIVWPRCSVDVALVMIRYAG